MTFSLKFRDLGNRRRKRKSRSRARPKRRAGVRSGTSIEPWPRRRYYQALRQPSTPLKRTKRNEPINQIQFMISIEHPNKTEKLRPLDSESENLPYRPVFKALLFSNLTLKLFNIEYRKPKGIDLIFGFLGKLCEFLGF